MNGPTLPEQQRPTPAPTSGPTTAPTTAPAAVPQLPLSFTIPTVLVQSAARAPQSTGRVASAASSETLTVTINTVNGSTTLPANVPATTQIALALGGNCTQSGSGETCTVTIPAPPGTVDYRFDIKDSANTVIGTFSLTTTNAPGQTSVGNGQPPMVAVAVKSVSLALNGTLTPGTAADVAVTVTARDANGSVITGTKDFARPVMLADGESTSATGLALDGGTLAKTVSIASPAHTVTLHYDGSAIPPFALTASGDTFPTSSITVTPGSGSIAISGTTLDTIAASDPNYEQPTLYFDVVGKTRSFTASEPGWSDHGHGFTVTPDPATCGSGASAIVTVASSDQLTFNVTSANGGLCKLTVSDGLGTSTRVWASVSTATIGVH